MGSILITQEGAETLGVKAGKRDEAFRNFFGMVDSAVDTGDRMYMTSSAYQHRYSYGDYYPAFVNMSWEEFSSIPSLSGVSWNTWNYIVNDFARRYPAQISNEQELQNKDEPRGRGGFEHQNSPDDFLCDVIRWKKWHRNYLANHPNRIVWPPQSTFLPNPEAICLILDEEIDRYVRHKFTERVDDSDNPEKEVSIIRAELFRDKTFHQFGEERKPLKKNAQAIFFHRVIMPAVGHNRLAGFCIMVGDKICKENYYTYEPHISSDEQQAAGAQRRIWSIVRNSVKQYISFDFHKGMFEFHDQYGIHLGEYMFDGTQNSGPQADHNLRTLQK